MDYISLGKSNLMVSRVGFGAMSLGEIDTDENASALVHKAYDAGVNFFDISHSAKESEKRLGACLYGIRHNVVLATKACVLDARDLEECLDDSLSALRTDYIDLFQYETDEKNIVAFDEIAAQMERLKERGKIRHFGLTTEDFEIAARALDSSVFASIQIPFNILVMKQVESLVKKAQEGDIGFVAMKPLYGGLVRNIPLALGFLYQYENVVPLWGVRNLEELSQILYFNAHPPLVDEQFESEVENIRAFFS